MFCVGLHSFAVWWHVVYWGDAEIDALRVNARAKLLQCKFQWSQKDAIICKKQTYWSKHYQDTDLPNLSCTLIFCPWISYIEAARGFLLESHSLWRISGQTVTLNTWIQHWKSKHKVNAKLNVNSILSHSWLTTYLWNKNHIFVFPKLFCSYLVYSKYLTIQIVCLFLTTTVTAYKMLRFDQWYDIFS